MKDILITGAGSGIGAATAQVFAKKGWRVFLLGRDSNKLETIQKQLPSPSYIVRCDLSNATEYQALKRQLDEHGCNLSALVNNAGIYKPNFFQDETDEHWEQHFATNLLGPVRLTRLLWPQLKKNKGCITNVSSTLGIRPISRTGAYSAFKAALNNWTQTLALEGAADGIRANSICPGLVDTPIHSYHQSNNPEHIALHKQLQKLQPLGRMGQPMDIAHAIYFTCSEEASWMTGAIIPVDGGVVVTTKDP